jgi:LysM repeat protein
MNNCPSRVLRIVAGLIVAGAFLLALPAHVARAEGEQQDATPQSAAPQSGECNGSYYTVRRGDTWSIISRRAGIPIPELKRANPQAVRSQDLIYAGERLCIPSQSQSPGGTQTPTQSGGYWYQVKPGDTWNKISRATGISVRELWAANPGLVNRQQWLYIGQRVWIPQAPQGSATAAATAAPSASAEVTAEAVMTPTMTPTATALPPATPVPTATTAPTAAATAALTATPAPTAASTSAPAATALPTALPPKPADCPKTLAEYDASIARFLNNPANNVDRLNRSLALCRVAPADAPAAVIADITGPKSQDVIVAINDPSAEGPGAGGALLVYHKAPGGYALAHKRAGQGRLELIEAGDVNQDKKFDLVYSDTSCGAHTCFGTLFVDSWDGKTYADWIEDEPTIAGPEYSIKEVATDGEGEEIQVHGGVIGSVGAGPQRAWTETYISPAGGPYKLLSQVYDPSDCLYHQIVDANRAFDAWALDGFDPAIEAYEAALTEKNSQACGSIKDEVKTLQDFARFRLVVAQVAAGNAPAAIELAPQITHPGLKKAVTSFLGSYTANTSVIQACRDVTKLAESDTTTWQYLADWGYANPSFTAQELCPLN